MIQRRSRSTLPQRYAGLRQRERETAPPVRLLGILPIRSDASTVPPDDERLPVAARSVVPVAGTATCAPGACPPNVCPRPDEISPRPEPSVRAVRSRSMYLEP